MALPALNAATKPSANSGLGSVANTNTASAPTNDNAFDEQAAANQLAREKAYSRGQSVQNNASGIPFSSPANTQPQTDDAYEDENLDSDSESEEGQNSALIQSQQIAQRQQQIRAAQTQITLQQQQQAAAAMTRQKQARLRSLLQEDQQLDSEITTLQKDLDNFKESGAKKSLAFFNPQITFLIENTANNLKKEASRLPTKRKLSFLKKALITLTSLITLLVAARFVTAFIDAVIWWAKWVFRTIETIIGAIIIFLLGFILVPFLTVLFFIDKIPVFKGKMTHQVTKLTDKLKQRSQVWKKQINKLEQIVSRQDRKKANQKQEEQLQKQP